MLVMIRWYAQSVNKTVKELGVSQKSVQCLFDLAKHNSSLFHQTFTKVNRSVGHYPRLESDLSFHASSR
jgi:hypothetical protein